MTSPAAVARGPSTAPSSCRASWPWSLSLSLFVLGCTTREIPPRGATFEDVAPVLEAACAECHGEARAEAGYRVDGYIRAIGCPATDTTSVVEPPDDGAALAAVLARPDHAGLLTGPETLLVSAWIADGAPARRGSMHPTGMVDPRSPDFHGALLRSQRWAPLLDPTTPTSCARCHAGATVGPDDSPGVAPGATACTSCHTEPEGPFACSTCHGSEGHAYPPRDSCWHPDEAGRAGAHALHVARGLTCVTCHGERYVEWLASGRHGDGVVDVVLDPTRAGPGARYDASTRTCSTTCHDRGGTVATPRWEGAVGLDCNSCHTSPPAAHYAGACSRCHAEASEGGTALTPGPLHANGVVDLGDGTGGCGACHGEGDDPTPSMGAHGAHADPALARPFDCAECHTVPTEVGSAGHLDTTPTAEVTFGALAAARGVTPVRDASGACAVACHGVGLGGGTVAAPHFDDASGAPAACGACHSTPPPPPHTTATTCSALMCHGGYSTAGPGVSELGRDVHVNGGIDLWAGR